MAMLTHFEVTSGGRATDLLRQLQAITAIQALVEINKSHYGLLRKKIG